MFESDRIVCTCEVVGAGDVAVRGVNALCPEHGDPRDTSVGQRRQESAPVDLLWTNTLPGHWVVRDPRGIYLVRAMPDG